MKLTDIKSNNYDFIFDKALFIYNIFIFIL